jgi:hypothetical protein
LHQLRLVKLCDLLVVNAVKRDKALLQSVRVEQGARVTALYVALETKHCT